MNASPAHPDPDSTPETLSPEEARAHLRKRRRQRLDAFWLIVASYGIDALLMLALVWAGALSLSIPLGYAGVAIAVNAFFYVVLSSGWTERFRDHYIALPYMMAHSAVNLGFIVIAPEIGGLMIMVQFIIFSTSALRMNLNRMLTGAALTALLAGAMIVALGSKFSLPTETVPQRLISGLWFSLCLMRISLVGLFSSQLRDLLARRNKQLAETFAKLDELATHDELTGVLNRRAIMQLLEDERQRQARTGKTFAIALLDIDHFKQINDHFGHLTGDDVLRRFAQAVADSMRTTDRLGRYGGEEFLVLFTATTGEDLAIRASERIRGAVTEQDWNRLTPGRPVTVSAGVAVCAPEETAEQLLARADAALYRAKHEGRNCVRIGNDADQAGPVSTTITALTSAPDTA